MDGGVASFDEFIACMLELPFGVCRRLKHITGHAERTLSQLRELEMDFYWAVFDDFGVQRR